ncbi:MAG TPA: NAD-dependent epimerase/dehydratase family protein [Dehalococcoidia bacterium]|nr:NAD-dependent epimerase/dehydratase family protein [Dehalococcoidia bacterium]
MKVMVTGGTGFVGSHTVAELIRNGHEVRLLVRSRDKIGPALQPLDVQDVDAVQGDVLDRTSIERAAEGCDATIHCGSVYSLDPRAAEIIRSTNVAGTEIVLDVAHRLGHDPIIHVSSFVALIGANGSVLTPDSPPTEPPGTYFRSKADSDQVARKFQEIGAPVVITYPGSVWGPYDPHLGESCQIARNILKGIWRMTVKGSIPISDVRDIARLHTVLMEKGRGPRRYFTPMLNVTLKEAMSIISDVTGRKLDTVSLPGWALLLPMKGLDSLQKFLPLRLPFNFQAVYSVYLNHQADDSATRNDFGIEPRTLAETVTDQIRWMAQQGYVAPSLAGSLFSR